MNILCISAYEHSICQMGVENANTKLFTNFSKDTDVPQQKFISQLIQDETCTPNFNSESEQQSMQWND